MTFLSSLPDGFEFDVENHRYLVDGRRFASVTEIRDHFGLGPDYSGIPEATIARAGQRGDALHYAFACWLEGLVDEDIEVPGYQREFEAIIERAREARLVPWQVETSIVSVRDSIAGTPDFWGLVHDEPAILDLKTGATEGTGFQTSGYSILKVESLLRTERLSDIPKAVLHPKRYCLAVSGGRAKLTEIPGTEDDKNFRAAVRIYNLQRRGRTL